jgi:hypothetical protein
VSKRPKPALVRVGNRVYQAPDHTLVSDAGLELERAGRAWLDEADHDVAGSVTMRTEMRLARALRVWIELTGRL